MKTYTLTVTEAQAKLISEALETYARLGMGQIECIMGFYSHRDHFMEFVDEAMDAVFDAKRYMTGHTPSSNWGITSKEVPDIYRVAFDMHSVIQHQFAVERKANWSAYYHEAPLMGNGPVMVILPNE